MRYILAVIAVILLTIVLWPWIAEFINWAFKKYEQLTDFKPQQKENNTHDTNDTNEQND